jgi:hypothetical protein
MLWCLDVKRRSIDYPPYVAYTCIEHDLTWDDDQGCPQSDIIESRGAKALVKFDRGYMVEPDDKTTEFGEGLIVLGSVLNNDDYEINYAWGRETIAPTFRHYSMRILNIGNINKHIPVERKFVFYTDGYQLTFHRVQYDAGEEEYRILSLNEYPGEYYRAESVS